MALMDDAAVAQRILDHIDNGTTDVFDADWREPVANYRSAERLERELARVFRATPTPFCPSAALPGPGAFLARAAAGTPLLAARGADGRVRVFRNACRHRGAQVACGQGEARAFICPYHAWTYGLDGALRGAPHEQQGFPGLDKAAHGLVAVHAVEHGGLVFVTQARTTCADSGGGDDVTALPVLLGADLRLFSTREQVSDANWKIAAEGFLEGYHIMPTHRETFYPVQFDNLNVVEQFGRNSRVTFPYRNVERLRALPPDQREVGGVLTYVYHLFPNVIIATFPRRTIMSVLEPDGIGRTRTVTYSLARASQLDTDRPAVDQATDFVNAGAREDQAVVESIQRGRASGANEVFTFGRFEGASVRFHRNLHALLAA